MNYQPLFNKLADLGYLETESEIMEIVNAVNDVQGVAKLLTITRRFLISHNRYMASSTQGRLKEMQAAQKELEKELNDWPEEKEVIRYKPEGLF